MKKVKMPKLSLKREGGAKHYAKKYWYVFFLIALFLTSWHVRSIPGRWNELIGLDEFHIYRIAHYALHHGLMIPDFQNPDMMRYSPYGVPTYNVEYLMPIYLPVFAYLFLSALGLGMPFFEFAIFFPALLGAVGAITAFFIAKELFKSNVSALFSALFVSVTPALFTRTSAASFEKEATAVIFMMAAIWLFFKAYNRGSLSYGILAGISLGFMGMSWGGVQYIQMLMSSFLFVLFIANVVLVVLDYLFQGFRKHLDGLEPFIGSRMLKAFAPMVIIGTSIPLLEPLNPGFTGMGVLSVYSALAMLAIRYSVVRLNLVKKEKVHYVIPALMLAAAIIALGGMMLTDFFDSMLTSVSSLLSLSKGVVGSTVAENAPGDWGTIFSTLGTGFSAGTLPQLSSVSWIFSLVTFMFLGLLALVYEFLRTRNYLLLFPIAWVASSIFGVFYVVRLLFILGPAAGIAGGFFFGWSAGHIRKLKFLSAKGWGFPKIGTYAAIIVFIGLLVAVNVASVYAYAMSMTTAICFPRTDSSGNIIPCITVDKDENEVMSLEGQPWYQSMDFLAKQTPEGSVVLSWWDFGYWFQTRGERPSVADGGNLGGIYLRNYELADWYMDRPENWSAYEPWMKKHNVSYIFMDYTLPGKYGAISQIGSRGKQVLGFLEFRRNTQVSSPLSNTTTWEYLSGPYAVWLTFNPDNTLAAPPMFLVSQNGRYFQKTYINEFCTTSGIVRVANETNSMPGCIAINTYLGQDGLFYVPAEIEHTIFNQLMFMQGYGLPVEKVFDNGAVQIYKVNYQDGVSASSA
jgi:dolichyl-diphosphooligosaccharide--protein glycosyltransferase